MCSEGRQREAWPLWEECPSCPSCPDAALIQATNRIKEDLYGVFSPDCFLVCTTCGLAGGSIASGPLIESHLFALKGLDRHRSSSELATKILKGFSQILQSFSLAWMKVTNLSLTLAFITLNPATYRLLPLFLLQHSEQCFERSHVAFLLLLLQQYGSQLLAYGVHTLLMRTVHSSFLSCSDF